MSPWLVIALDYLAVTLVLLTVALEYLA